MAAGKAISPIFNREREYVLMKTSFAELPTSVKKKKLALLKDELARGKPLNQFSQEDRDLLHMETSEENVRYWKEENERADADERCLYCQSVARSIIVALRANDPPVDDDDEKNFIISEIIAEADHHLLALH